MRDWGDRGRGRGYDSGGGGGGERDAGKQRPPDEEATERVYRVRQEIDSAATRVEQLPSIARRDEWRTEREKLQQTHDTLLENLKARELDAKASARAREHYTNATETLGDIAAKLTNAQEPRRPVPPVAGEEAIEPSIISRSAAPEDVLAWVSELDARDRRAIVSRFDAVKGGSVNRADGFAVSLANYFGDLTVRSKFPDLRSKFLKTAENPRHFDRAAYLKSRASANATADARAGTNETNRTAIKAPVARPTASTHSQESRGTTTGKQAAGTPPHALPVVSPDDSPADLAGDPEPPHVSASKGDPLPYRQEMERSFGGSFANIEAHTGKAAELGPLGAQAITVGHVVTFADAQPSPALVAHEATHAVQNEQSGVSTAMAHEITPTIQAKQTGTATPMAAGVVGPRHSPAEAEADAMAERVSAAGPGVKLPPVTAAPSASVQLAPAGEPKVEPLNAERYWAKYGMQTMQRALGRAMAELVFEISGPGLAFPTSECGAFIMSSLGWRMQDTTPHHVSQLLDAPIYELIDGVRVLDDRDRGPDAFDPAVVSRIVERLGLGIRHAVARVALPYAKARSRAVSAAKAEARDPIGRGLGPLQVPQGDPAPAQPDPNTLGARTTIEHAVAESMCAGFVEFHSDKFPLVYDTTIPGEPRPAKLELERGRGDWLTVRVVEPASASAVDVANALYGTPELAHLVVGSGNRFSYVFPPGKQLAEPYETEFRNHMLDDGASPLDELSARNTRDPVLGLDEARADQRALTSAKASGAVAKGAGAAPALQHLEILESVVDSIVSAAVPLGVAPIIAPLQARLRQRSTACAADPAEATKWAAHASEQLTLVSDAKAGFDAITEQMFAIGLPAVSTASGPELVGDVTASMQGPTRELAAAFAASVAASEQLDIGRERLLVAKERLAAYPFDMADRMLAVIRKRIASTGHHATMPMNSYETARMAALEAELGRTIGELRIAVVNGDGTAALKLTALRSQLSMLDLQSTIGSTLTAINELSGELRIAESMDPDNAREVWIYDQLHAAMGEWMQFAANYDSFWKAGHERDPATLEAMRTRLGALRSKTDLPALVHELAMFAEDEGKRQRWINIGIMIGAALLAAASGGIASGAIGGVAGSIVGAGIESLTFTSITSTLNQDPSFGGFMSELALNFATFGGLRAISGGAKFLVGSKALTLPQKLGEMTVEGLWMVASAKAQEKIAEAFAHGGKVTPQSAASIFGQQMAISFASRVLVRVGGVFVQGVTGIEKLHEVQLALAKRAEEEHLARQVLASGEGKLGEQLVKVDTDVLKVEQHALERVHEVASNPAEAAKHGITAEAGALERVAADAKGAAREVREREITALMAHAEVKADHAIVEPPVYAELVAKHRAQGSTIVEGFDSAGQPHAKITPSLADGSFGKPFTLHQRLGQEVEKILTAKNLPNTAVIGDYLAKRADDRAGALADLRKVNTPAELEQLMQKTLGEDVVAARERAAKPQQGNAASGPTPTDGDTPRFPWTNGLDEVQIEHVRRQLGDSLSSKVSTGAGALTGAELVKVADVVSSLRQTSNVRGIDDWIAFEQTQNAPHLRDALAELRSAERRAAENPGQIFEIGGDKHAPIREGTINARNPGGDPMQSFDMTAREGDTIVKSIEVTSADGPVRGSSDLTSGVRHATDKIAGRAAEKTPIPGKELEVEIRVEMFKGEKVAGTGTVTYDGAGNYTYKVNNGTVTPPKFGRSPNPGNIFADFAKELPKIGGSHALDTVTLVDGAGNVVATFRREGNVWKWLKEPKS